MSALSARHLSIVLLPLVAACSATSSHRLREAKRTVSQPIAIDAAENLDVEVRYGSIRIDTGDASPVVVARINARAETDAAARALAEDVEIRVERDAQRVVVRAARPGGAELDDVDVSFEVTVPDGVVVRCRSVSGEIGVLGAVSGCDAETRFGAVHVDGVRGAVRAASGSGDVSVRSVDGPEVSAESRFGAVSLHDIEARHVATATTSSGDVIAQNVSASSVELATDFGVVRGTGIRGALRATTRSGDVRLNDVEGPTTSAHSRFGSIELSGLLRAVTVQGSSGDIRIRALQGSSCTVPWSIYTRFGNVELVVPRSFDADARLEAFHGVVTTDAPVSVAEARVGGQGTVVTRLGDGGASLDIETTSGSIVLRRRDL